MNEHDEATLTITLCALETYIAQLKRTAKAMTAKGMPEAGQSLTNRERTANTLMQQLAQGTVLMQRADLGSPPAVSPSTLKNK